MMLALSGFIIPFSFVYDPAILLVDAALAGIVFRTAAAGLGILMLGAGLIGYLRAPALGWQRLALLVGAVCLIFPGVWLDVAGALAFVAVWLSQRPAATPAVAVPAEERE
jgi:TRAP-type uncharacterized transport system fused permease subunit